MLLQLSRSSLSFFLLQPEPNLSHTIARRQECAGWQVEPAGVRLNQIKALQLTLEHAREQMNSKDGKLLRTHLKLRDKVMAMEARAGEFYNEWMDEQNKSPSKDFANFEAEVKSLLERLPKLPEPSTKHLRKAKLNEGNRKKCV